MHRTKTSVQPLRKFRIGAWIHRYEYKIGASFGTEVLLIQKSYFNVYLGRRYLCIPLADKTTYL